MDGSRTPRSDMASSMAKWANDPEQAALWEAKPVRGEIGILVIRETQEWDYLLNYERKEKPYPEAMWGAYRAFLEQGLQPDWVHIDDIDTYDFLYFPYPIMFTAEQAARLKAWVEKGGTLISEACPGYFGDRGHVGQVQPNMGLDAVFGAREEEVEFMPDIGERIRFKLDGLAADGGGLLQSYRLTSGTGRGHFIDGRLAVVENSFGKGRTLLIGTNPSVAYYRSGGRTNGAFFAALIGWNGRKKHVTLSNSTLFARIHSGEKGSFLWLVNPTRSAQSTEVTLAEGLGTLKPGAAAWPLEHAYDGRKIEVPARDALILALG
jgi:beta-galactosidase